MTKINDLLFDNFKPNPTEVGLRIKEIRLNLGYSMDEFASKIDGTAKSGTISNWETGKNLPNNKRLKRISEIGGVSLSYLLKGEKSIDDISEDEFHDSHEKIFNKIFKATQNNDLQKYTDIIFKEDLSDWQISLLISCFKFTTEFKDDDEILSLFDSIINNSRVVISKNLHNTERKHEDYIHSQVLLQDDLEYLQKINTIK